MWTAHDLQLFQDKSGIISNEEFATALGGLFFIIRAAIKQRVPVKTLQKCLKDLDFDKGKSEKLIAEIHAERFSLENVSKSLRIRHPRLDRLKWRNRFDNIFCKGKNCTGPLCHHAARS